MADTNLPRIELPESFKIRAQDERLQRTPTGIPTDERDSAPAAPPTAPPTPPLGVLQNFDGIFSGHGFNLIFRPNSAAPTTTTFPKPVTPTPPTAPSENVLELNLTQETLSFGQALGSIPNRGLQSQNDIFLNGVPYMQVVNDVTNPETGRADGTPSGIHFENGIWMHVPATTTDPVLGESLVRMGSIPHGTTINAQALAPSTSFAGPPNIPSVDITPFLIGKPSNTIKFIAQTASNDDTPRLPQDLSKFIAAGTITQAILDDPNTVLRSANQGKNIKQTIVFTVSTAGNAPELGGGTANIAFLQGGPSASGATGGQPNANAVQMQATFWINTVEWQITIPSFKVGDRALEIKPTPPQAGAPVPTFLVTPPRDITTPTTVTVTSTEIQYSQLVLLNFAALTWPHVSVATLVHEQPQTVPASVFG